VSRPQVNRSLSLLAFVSAIRERLGARWVCPREIEALQLGAGKAVAAT
jgi:hypothetical protein